MQISAVDGGVNDSDRTEPRSMGTRSESNVLRTLWKRCRLHLFQSVLNTFDSDRVPILLGSVRSESLTPPSTADICINADFDRGDCFLWRNASLLYSRKSEIQLVEVVIRQSGQRCLLLDAAVQFCDSADNDLYTHALTEPV